MATYGLDLGEFAGTLNSQLSPPLSLPFFRAKCELKVCLIFAGQVILPQICQVGSSRNGLGYPADTENVNRASMQSQIRSGVWELTRKKCLTTCSRSDAPNYIHEAEEGAKRRENWSRYLGKSIEIRRHGRLKTWGAHQKNRGRNRDLTRVFEERTRQFV